MGDPCIIETAISEHLSEQYHLELQVDEDDIADSMRIKHLVDVEIKLMRCNRLMSMNPELVYTSEDVDGTYAKKLNPIARYDLLLMRERGKVLRDLLYTTRTAK